MGDASAKPRNVLPSMSHYAIVCSMKTAIRAGLLAFSLVLVPGLAHAEDTTPQDRARVLFESGKTARDAKDFATALRFFRESHDTSPSASFDALVNMADCEHALGQTLAAYLHYGEYLRKTNGSDARAPEITTTMSAMKNAGPWIRVIRRDLLEPNTDFRIDGLALGPITGKAEDIPAEPGDHSILISEPTKGSRTIIVHVEAGKRASVDFRPKGPQNSGTIPRTVETQSSTALPHWVFPAGIIVSAGGAVATLATGTVSAIEAANQQKALEADCAKDDGNGTTCNAANVPDFDFRKAEVDRLQNAALGLLVTGGVLTTSAVVLTIVNHSKRREMAFSPLFLPGGGGASVSGRF